MNNNFRILGPVARVKIVVLVFGLLLGRVAAGGASDSGLRFAPSLFAFVTTVKEGDRREPGGWQEATAVLKFVDTRLLLPKSWTCRVVVGVPLRSKKYGQMSASDAAEIRPI